MRDRELLNRIHCATMGWPWHNRGRTVDSADLARFAARMKIVQGLTVAALEHVSQIGAPVHLDAPYDDPPAEVSAEKAVAALESAVLRMGQGAER